MYSRQLLFILFLWLPLGAEAQEFAINLYRHNVFYIGEDNPITIAATRYRCIEIEVKASEGTVVKATDNPCRYNIMPDAPGKSIITLQLKKDGKAIGESEYRNRWPNVRLEFAGRTEGGNVKKANCINDRKLMVRTPDLDFETAYKVQQFKISVIRKEQTLYSEEIQGSILTDQTIKFFQQLQTGDVVKFNDVFSEYPDGKIRRTESAEFSVVE